MLFVAPPCKTRTRPGLALLLRNLALLHNAGISLASLLKALQVQWCCSHFSTIGQETIRARACDIAMPNPKEAVNWCQSTVVSLSEVTEELPLVSKPTKNMRRGKNKFERCSKTLRSPWRAGGRGGRIDNLWNPTCWTVNRGRGSDLKPDKGSTEHIHVGATPGLIRFIHSYLPENAEMQNWRGNVCYSLNKKKRWELSSKIENLFKESAEELASEDFEISIADLHCGNSKFKALYRNHGDNFTFFDRRTGRVRTVIEGQPVSINNT